MWERPFWARAPRPRESALSPCADECGGAASYLHRFYTLLCGDERRERGGAPRAAKHGQEQRQAALLGVTTGSGGQVRRDTSSPARPASRAVARPRRSDASPERHWRGGPKERRNDGFTRQSAFSAGYFFNISIRACFFPPGVVLFLVFAHSSVCCCGTAARGPDECVRERDGERGGGGD